MTVNSIRSSSTRGAGLAAGISLDCILDPVPVRRCAFFGGAEGRAELRDTLNEVADADDAGAGTGVLLILVLEKSLSVPISDDVFRPETGTSDRWYERGSSTSVYRPYPSAVLFVEEDLPLSARKPSTLLCIADTFLVVPEA